MSLTFTKLFSSITESTIWFEPHATRLVWITMLAMADRNGLVFASVPGLAHRARVTEEDCETALERLSSPDTKSRTKLHEGRRIAEVDGGWELLNHGKYRAVQDVEAIRESKREHMRRKRGGSVIPQWNPPSASASASDSVGIPEEVQEEPKRTRRKLTSLPTDFAPTAQHRTIAEQEGVSLEGQFSQFTDWCAANDARRADWAAAFRGWLRRAKSFGVAARGSSGAVTGRNRAALDRIAKLREQGL